MHTPVEKGRPPNADGQQSCYTWIVSRRYRLDLRPGCSNTAGRFYSILLQYQPQVVARRVSQVLRHAKIPFGRFNTGMAQG